MNDPYDIGVIGAGAWGTALAVLNANAGKRVALCARDSARAAAMVATRANPRLPGIALPQNLAIFPSTVIARSAATKQSGLSSPDDDAVPTPGAKLLLIAVPMQHLRATLAALPPGPAPLVLCCKGLESATQNLPPEVAAALHPGRPTAILTGPNFAHEIAAGLPAASVLATPDAKLRARLIAALRTDSLRLYGSADATGAALAGAAKNVIAIAAGVVMGAGLGENARAALITRGIAEIARLATALGGKAETISGLSGLGDLLLTCTGTTSRNYSLGHELGQGKTLAAILQTRTGVTEGVATAPALLARATAATVDMPITAAVTALLCGDIDVPQAIAAIMGRSLRDE
jgi:glycerol-3-phosphate dehydrogenase (NAD(P)+)